MAGLTYKQWKRDNWDRAHQEHDITALTGTGLGGHLNTLVAKEYVLPTSSVLCIGVGIGSWIAELVPKVLRISALDISPVAASRMPKGVIFYSDPRKLPSEVFDLALSLWVAPHMNNVDLQEQLGEVIRSLRVNGVFALHYKEPIKTNQIVDNREGQDDEWIVARGAMMLRKREYFAEMTQRAGGYVEKIAAEHPSQFHKIIEASVHIRKGAGP